MILPADGFDDPPPTLTVWPVNVDGGYVIHW